MTGKAEQYIKYIKLEIIPAGIPMVVILRTIDGEVRSYETVRGEGGGEYGPDKYVTKCGMEWKRSPNPYETCDHIECAIDILRRKARGGIVFLLIFLLIGIASFLILKDEFAVITAGFFIFAGIGSFVSSSRAENKLKELEEYNYQGTINGIRAFPVDVLIELIDEKDLLSYGHFLCDNGRYDDAIKAFNKVTGLNPNSTSTWNEKGKVLKLQNRHNDAIIAFNRALELDPKFIDAWNNKGMALYDQGEYDKAVVAYDNALKVKPKYARTWYNKGLVLYAQGKYHEAILAYDKAIKNDSKIIDALFDKDIFFDKSIIIDSLYDKSIALRSLGQIKEADETLDQAKRELNCKGADLANCKLYLEAIQAFDKIIGIDPKFICAWINKSITLSKMGRFGEAIGAINQAIEINPESPRAWKYKGIILKKAGQKADSKLALARARELGYKG
ncbi:MAG: tetratricopeptide repeat protein [Methanothrix sp.]|uniref:tetratricopeptide repeat protein n=1 Tax=Methanothrix sp. TaxID=90426 RepID=UPI0025E208A9|nr:tetratricopeptide repeat protein [Methanothrix sp.]MBK7386844.1 tetratricopeptide repeat protein [Methanothrix sp.]